MMKKGLLFLLMAWLAWPCSLFSQTEPIYQLPNSGFESWYRETSTNANSIAPSNFNSFYSASGGFAGMAAAKRCDSTRDVRPGSTGQFSLKLFSTSIISIRANGNMTTGRINANNMSAAHYSNYNYTDYETNAPKHYQEFSALPDSMRFWVKYLPGRDGSTNTTDKGRIRILIHGNGPCRDAPSYPDGMTETEQYYGKAVKEFYKEDGGWHCYTVPFVYDGTNTQRNANNNYYVLVSMTSNATPGGGANSADQVWFDDIEMIYNPCPADITLNGTTITGFSPFTYDYYHPGTFCGADVLPVIAATTISPRAIVNITEATPSNPTTTVVISHGDSSMTYRVHFNIINNTPIAQDSSRCNSGSVTLSATAPQEGDICRWYLGMENTTPFHTGSSYTTPQLTQSTTYYVSSYRPSTDCESEKIPVTAHIIPRPAVPVIEDIVSCGIFDSTLIATVEEGYNCCWYASATATEPLFVGQEYNVRLEADTTFYLKTIVPEVGCSSNMRSLTISINDVPTISFIGTDTICENTPVELSAATTGDLVRWFNAAEDGDTIHTGNTLSTTLSETTTFYIQAVNQSSNCQSVMLPVTITVIPSGAESSYSTTEICDTTIFTILKIDDYHYAYHHSQSIETEDEIRLFFTENAMLSMTITDNLGFCSSTIDTNISVRKSFERHTTISTCDAYTWMGQTYDTSGIYFRTGMTQFGCDSIYTLHLTIGNETIIEIFDTICPGTPYNENDFNLPAYDTAGNYTATIHIESDGEICDTTIRLYLRVNESYQMQESKIICATELPYTYLGEIFTEEDTRTISLFTQNGCDSIITFSLFIAEPVTHSFDVEICNSFTWNGITYDSTGSYSQSLIAANGCDSIVTLNLTISDGVDTTIFVTACLSYTWHDMEYTESGIYSHRYDASNGCDSTVILNLTIGGPTAYAFRDMVCLNEPYREHGFDLDTQETAGTFVHQRIIANAAGCDSTITLTLVVNTPYDIVDTRSECEFYIWNDSTYTTSGTYTHTFESVGGCDSVVTLNLTINQPINVAIYDTICQGDTYSYLDFNLPAQNRAGDTMIVHRTPINACDSITTLHLTVNPSYYIRITDTTQTGVTYNEHGFYIENTSAGIARDTLFLQTADGCDSTVQLLLFIMTGIDKYEDIANINIFPNPAHSSVSISSDLLIEDIDIYDAMGKLITTRKRIDTHSMKHNVSDLAPGVYIIKIHTEKGVSTRKLIVN